MKTVKAHKQYFGWKTSKKHGRIRFKRMHIITTDFKEAICRRINCIQLAQDGVSITVISFSSILPMEIYRYYTHLQI
jgi:hypothetical protein